MTRLEDIKAGTSVRGISSAGIARVVGVEWYGDQAIKVVYEDGEGSPQSRLLFRNEEASLEVDASEGPWSFDGDGALLRLVSEANRIRLAHLFDPYLAVHTSRIEPLPHQITAVYSEMLGRQPLRFLLADDPGAGKTIMTGLLIKELMVRGDLERCLVVTPGNLVEQWQDELAQKFGLAFTILTREGVETSMGNPFEANPLMISRLDMLSRNEDLKERLTNAPEYDLIVVDEAHKMSASYIGGKTEYTKRYHLGETVRDHCRHFLLLSATPHSGKQDDFELFMALLDEDRFEGKPREGTHRASTDDLMRRLVKEELYTFDGKHLFPERHAYTVNYELSPEEQALYEEVTDYVRDEMNRAERFAVEAGDDRRRVNVGFALTILQRRLASSPEAIYRSLTRRRERLEKRLAAGALGDARQVDATTSVNGISAPIISTDPPYYDNIGYADLSDFFYVWLRRSLANVHPGIFGTMLVPKSQELVATPYRFDGSKQQAQEFFEEGLGNAFARMRERANPEYPITVYYAFKQAESQGNGDGTMAVASTGWETMLEGLRSTGFQITGTWPMRSELGNRMIASGTNALASSIVLVCRLRSAEAPPATRQEFVRALRRELPDALSVMMAENVAPVDLAQATIGPGMAIYSRYSKVIEADGSPMRVRTALQIINQSLDEHLAEAEGAVDPHTRFALTWFEQRGMQDGPYGEAESVATARNVSVRGVQDAGILEAKAGKVRLIPRERLAEDWDPATDDRLTDWEVVQHLIRALQTEGETGAARLLARVGERGEGARDLAYRLYGICERKKWAEEALAFNGLVVSWPEITRLAAENPSGTEAQGSFEL